MICSDMSRIVPLTITEVMPKPESVLMQMGVPRRAAVSSAVQSLVENAIEILSQYAAPAGVMTEISEKQFTIVYAGEGCNARDTPLEHIFPQARRLAVYALTLGEKISGKIAGLCNSGDVALGGALDAAASVAADNGSEFCEQFFYNLIAKKQPTIHDTCVLAYSPGYCGWHVTGQKKLFQLLKPERVGIELNDNCLMHPIKSVSGVLVAGAREINYFEPHWDFCEPCTTYSCLQRMKNLRVLAKQTMTEEDNVIRQENKF